MFTTEDTKITKFKKSFIRQYSETFVAFVCFVVRKALAYG